MKKLYTIFFPIIVLILLVLFLPAAWIVKHVQQQIPELFIENTSGFLWQGGASHVEVISRGYTISLDDVSWQVDRKSLSVLRPCILFFSTSPVNKSRGTLCVYPFKNKIVFYDTDVDVSATEVSELLGIEIQGLFQARVNTLHIDGAKLEGMQGDIIWRKAEFFNGSDWLTLGELLMDVSSNSNNNTISVSWLDMEDRELLNPMDVNMEMLFVDNELSSITGSITPKLQYQSLLDTLDLISDSQEDGIYFFEKIFATSSP